VKDIASVIRARRRTLRDASRGIDETPAATFATI
jgi:hypothetical protein